MEETSKVRKFINRNLVTIVMVPLIIAGHIGWRQLQKNKELVNTEKEMELPTVIFYRYCLRRLGVGQTTKETSKPENS